MRIHEAPYVGTQRAQLQNSSKQLIVGNHCVANFGDEMGEEVLQLHQSLKRIQKSSKTSKFDETMTFAEHHVIVTSATLTFMRNIKNKRISNLSVGQLTYRQDLNERISAAFSGPPQKCSRCEKLIFVKSSGLVAGSYFTCQLARFDQWQLNRRMVSSILQ